MAIYESRNLYWDTMLESWTCMDCSVRLLSYHPMYRNNDGYLWRVVIVWFSVGPTLWHTILFKSHQTFVNFIVAKL